MDTKLPEIGMLVTVRGIVCKVYAIRGAGTVDVQAVNGDQCFRISGLPFLARVLAPLPKAAQG